MHNAFFGKYSVYFKIMYFLGLFAVLFFIFYNSVLTGMESSANSDKLAGVLQQVANKASINTTVNAESLRSSAHFFEFFVLGAVLCIGIFMFEKNRFAIAGYTLAFSLLFALVDETIQLFSNGRSAEIPDVWIDLAGAASAHLFVIAVYLVYLSIMAKHKRSR